MRYNDIRDGTNNTEEVLKKYEASLVRKGMLNDSGLYPSFFALKQEKAFPARQGAHTAWANAFMNSWNSAKVHSLYDSQVMGFLTEVDGKTRLQPSRVANAFRRLVAEEDADPESMDTLHKARQQAPQFASPLFPFETISWGCFLMMLSEMGKKKQLKDLLEYADSHLNPAWENGGLYYPRNDQLLDHEHNMIHMEPHSGNSGIGYARLNVADGQKKMWEQPWTGETLASRPWVDGLTLGDGVDFLRGAWDEEKRAMVITLRSWSGERRDLSFTIQNLKGGTWATYVNGELKQVTDLVGRKGLEISVSVADVEVDIVVAAT